MFLFCLNHFFFDLCVLLYDLLKVKLQFIYNLTISWWNLLVLQISINNNRPSWIWGRKAPQIIILPPPCFIIGMMLELGLYFLPCILLYRIHLSMVHFFFSWLQTLTTWSWANTQTSFSSFPLGILSNTYFLLADLWALRLFNARVAFWSLDVTISLVTLFAMPLEWLLLDAHSLAE